MVLPALREGERHEIRVPGNGIDEAGVDLILAELRNKGVTTIPKNDTEEWRWLYRVGGKGVYVGTVTKRVAKWSYEKHAIKLDENTISRIGNLGVQYCDKAATYYFDFSQKFDWRNGDFGDHSSCIMKVDGQCFKARDLMRHVGCWAMRFYDSDAFTNGIGRCWLWPISEHVMLAFNGYWKSSEGGDADHPGGMTLKLARIFAQWAEGAYYKKITLHKDPKGVMYVNSSVAVAIGDQPAVSRLTEYALPWIPPEPAHVCQECDTQHLEKHMVHYQDDDWYCKVCWDRVMCSCDHCSGSYRKDDTVVTTTAGFTHKRYCETCYLRNFLRCCTCRGEVRKGQELLGGGNKYCAACHAAKYFTCVACKTVHPKARALNTHDGPACTTCHRDLFQGCGCGVAYRKPKRKLKMRGVTSNLYWSTPGSGIVPFEQAHVYDEDDPRLGFASDKYTREYLPDVPSTCPACRTAH